MAKVSNGNRSLLLDDHAQLSKITEVLDVGLEKPQTPKHPQSDGDEICDHPSVSVEVLQAGHVAKNHTLKGSYGQTCSHCITDDDEWQQSY